MNTSTRIYLNIGFQSMAKVHGAGQRQPMGGQRGAARGLTVEEVN